MYLFAGDTGSGLVALLLGSRWVAFNGRRMANPSSRPSRWLVNRTGWSARSIAAGVVIWTRRIGTASIWTPRIRAPRIWSRRIAGLGKSVGGHNMKKRAARATPTATFGEKVANVALGCARESQRHIEF